METVTVNGNQPPLKVDSGSMYFSAKLRTMCELGSPRRHFDREQEESDFTLSNLCIAWER